MSKSKLPKWAAEIKDAGGVNGDETHWNPEPGDVLVGTVAGYRERETPYGAKDILIVETDDGPVSLWVSHKALVNEMRKWSDKLKASNPPRLDASTEVAIEYLGRQKSKEGNNYEAYKVYARAVTPF